MAAVTAIRRVRGSARPNPPARLVRLLARLALLGGCALAGYVVLAMLDGPAFADGRTGPDARPGLLGSLAGPESPLPRTLLGDHTPSVPKAPPVRDRSAARPERSSNGSDRTLRVRTTRDRTAPREVERTRTTPRRVERAGSTSDRHAQDRRTPIRTVQVRAGSDRAGSDRAGSDRAGSDRAGSDRAGPVQAGPVRAAAARSLPRDATPTSTRDPVTPSRVLGLVQTVTVRVPVVVAALPAVVDGLPQVLPSAVEGLPEVVGRVPTLAAAVPGVVETMPEVMSAVPDGGSGSGTLSSTVRTGQPVHPIPLAGPPPSQPAQPTSVLAAVAVPALIPASEPVGPPAPRSDRIFETGAAGATSRTVARVADSEPPFGPNPPVGTGPAGQQATPVIVNGGQSVTIPATIGWQNPPRFPLSFSHRDLIRAGRWPGVPALPG
ncbi:hypothetical protein ACFP2T_11705 [Plantactinospora solaniradicis]|uniref:Uncharacterized protein n=1 Tax=Plantactinospora solaniradicis TaxID=1723736 RepID=A0ABW1K777_9ACTN